MPRNSRIDAAGALHDIIARGIDRGKIFQDPADKRNFLDRLADMLKSTKTCCYAWALIPVIEQNKEIKRLKQGIAQFNKTPEM